MCGEVHARRSRPMCFWYHCRRQPRITLNDTRYTVRWLYVSGDAETSAEFNMSAVCSGRQKCERPGSFFTLQTKQCHTIGRNITDVMTLQEEMSTRNTDGTIKKKVTLENCRIWVWYGYSEHRRVSTAAASMKICLHSTVVRALTCRHTNLDPLNWSHS